MENQNQEQQQPRIELKDLLHRRVLLGEKVRYSGNEKILAEEYKVLEISPSMQWVKLQNLHGKKFWKPTVEILLLELLEISDKPKNDNHGERGF